MTFVDWFRPRIDGTLHWQQALALSIGVLILLGPVSFWWRYEVQPKAAAREAVERSLGHDSRFRVTEIFNELDRHTDLLPVRSYADTLARIRPDRWAADGRGGAGANTRAGTRP